MARPGDVEYELGVPIPGVILPPEEWARTAIKKLPAAGPLDFAAIFGRRLVTPDFLALVHRSLVRGGLLVVQTDNPAYWRYMAAVVPRFFDFHQQKGPWPDAPAGRTRREIMARRKGLPVFRGFGHPRPELDAAALDSLVAELPAPDFDTEKASAARRRPHRRNKP